MTSTIAPTELTRQVRRDIAAGLSAEQARWLVDYYYSVQDYRIRAAGQARAVSQEADEGAINLAEHLTSQMAASEEEIKDALGAYAKASVPGQWALSILGMGPVLTAGLLAHIDIEQCPTVGHIWRFAGYDPTVQWKKGEKRPWNADLKVLCWRIAGSFVKFNANPKDVYGKVYVARKAREVERNEAGLFADQARHTLESRNIRDKALRETYEAGRLPAGRLDLRARRYAVKLFLAHFHHVLYEDHFGKPPPKPYVIEHLGHTHFISPPNWPMQP